jgi:hypothetical protein
VSVPGDCGSRPVWSGELDVYAHPGPIARIRPIFVQDLIAYLDFKITFDPEDRDNPDRWN